MPCFLCGEGAAKMIGQALNIPVYGTSHQNGHILAALYSAEKLDWLNHKFLAFHVSGGTTDCVLCQPDEKNLLHILPVSSSLDLKAGQLIDRVGLMMGLQFPCGAALEKLALQSEKRFRYKPVLKGLDCCLSGLENQCRDMIQHHEKPEVAKFCLSAVGEVLRAMTEKALEQYSGIPVLYAGGVMSNQYLQSFLKASVPAETAFAEPEFSRDNAAGTAVYAALRYADRH